MNNFIAGLSSYLGEFLASIIKGFKHGYDKR